MAGAGTMVGRGWAGLRMMSTSPAMALMVQRPGRDLGWVGGLGRRRDREPAVIADGHRDRERPRPGIRVAAHDPLAARDCLDEPDARGPVAPVDRGSEVAGGLRRQP